MSARREDFGPARLDERETEVQALKREIETLRREKAELREENDKLKQSLDKAIRSRSKPQPAPRRLRPSNSQSRATSATADSGTDSELRRQLNDTNEQLKRTIQQLSETSKQLLDVQSRLTISEQVTEATQRRQLIQEGAYQNLPANSVYEELRFDPSQEHVYAKLQPAHIGCSNVLLPRYDQVCPFLLLAKQEVIDYTTIIYKFTAVTFSRAKFSHRWLGSRLVSVLDSGAARPGFKSQPRRCRVTVLGKLFTPTVPLFTKQRNR